MTMQILEHITQRIEDQNPLHSKKIRKNLEKQDRVFFDRAELFFRHYDAWLNEEGFSIDYAVDCYLQMLADMNYEAVQFLRNGCYSSQSFEEVNRRVYSNPDVMNYYMHGLLLSQFLWSHHYEILIHFGQVLSQKRQDVTAYLEIGGGHGLYISEAVKIIKEEATFDLVDISASSLQIAEKMIQSDRVNYVHSDIFDYSPRCKYDWITMGEVLEHVENPVDLLSKVSDLLSEGGRIFVTTPTNAPAIDHIYLFHTPQDIRAVIAESGLVVEQELCICTEDVDQKFADEHKISTMYVATLTRK